MTDPQRITAEEVRQKLKTGNTLLVCAYEDDAKFRKVHLEGAISLGDLQSRLPTLEKDQEIVLYCA